MKTNLFLTITAIMALMLSSCKKNNTDQSQPAVNLADDEAVSEAVYDDVFNSVDIATATLDLTMKSAEAKSLLTPGDSCPQVTVDHPETGIWPKAITIDYGSGCTGFYDNTRAGKILILVTGPRSEAGSTRTVTFDNYYFNGIKVEGTKVLENMGLNSNNNFVVSVKLTGGKLTLPDGKTIERSFDHQREWIAGFLTKNLWDDQCLITGTLTGKNVEGISYIRTITTPVKWERVCRFPVSGILDIEREGKDPVILDYGSGQCDNLATVTINGETKEIQLRHHFRNGL